MASRGLGSLTLDLIAKIGGFTGPLDQAARNADKNFKKMGDSAERFGQGLGRSLKALGGQLLAFAGLTASVSAAVGSIKAAIDRADSLRDFAIRLDLSAEAASKFSYAATQTGTSVEALSKSLIILSKNAAAALNPKSKQAGLFKALLGPDYEKDLANLETLVPKVSDALNKLEDSTAKTGIQLALMGRNGAELKEFMALGSEGFKALADRASELGIVLSQETLDAADQFNDKLTDLKAATGGLATEVAAALLPQLTEMVDWAIDFVTDGDKVAELTTDLRQGFSDFADALSVANDIGSGFLSFAARSRGALQDMQSDFQEATVRIAEFFAVYEYQIKGAQRLRDNITKDFSNVQGSPTDLPKVTVVGNLKEFARQEAEKRKEAKKTQDEINKYLATGGKTGSGSKKKTGKSDAEKEAEALEKALRKMADAERDWQVELNDNGNPIAKEYASRLADITQQASKFKEDGIPTKEVSAFVDRMKELASSIQSKELAEFQKEFTNQTLELAAATQGPGAAGFASFRLEVEKLDKELKNSLITLQQYNERVDAMTTPFEEVTAAINEEMKLLGMTAKEQEIYNNLKAAGVEANSAWGQSIIENTEALQQLREETAFFDDLKEGLSDMFVDFVSGAKTAKEAFGDFADAIYKRALQFVADKAIQALFDAFSGKQQSGGSAQGSGWQNLFTSLLGSFGGGKASGGVVAANSFYRIAEQGPEVLSMNGSDYLITGKHGGMVTPNHALRGGMNQVNNFQFVGRVDRRTQDQVEATLAQRSRRAVARNS